MKKLPKVLISVLNWNNAPDTINCVQSVLKQNYQNFSLVVTDNASVDNSPSVLKNELPNVEFIFSKENLGYAGGNKLAWEWGRERGFDLFWIVNNDAEVLPDCLSILISAYKKFGDALYGGISVDESRKNIVFGGGFEFDEKESINFNVYDFNNQKKISELNLQTRKIGDVNGANMLIPFSVSNKYGFIDTSFFLYGEELDYCFKLRNKFDIQTYLVPKAAVIHKTSASFKKNKELKHIGIYYNARNWHYFQLNHLNNTRISLLITEYPFLKLFITFVQSIIFEKKYFLKNELRVRKLAFLHAILDIRGKVYEPNDYILK